MYRWFTYPLALTLIVSLVCCGGTCNNDEGGCNDPGLTEALHGYFGGTADPLTKVGGGPSREIDNVQIQFGTTALAGAVNTQAADDAFFWAVEVPSGDRTYMTGTFQQDGADVTVQVTSPAPRALEVTPAAADGIEINVTFTDDDHASGTIQLVDGANTYTGNIDLEREIVD